MRIAAFLAVLGLSSAALIFGPGPFARLALAVGAYELAVRLADDPMTQGLAHYGAGDYDEAAEAFRVVGAPATFNRGNALALAGRYREAIETYDAVIIRNPADEEAWENRSLIKRVLDADPGDPRPGDDIAGDGTLPQGRAPNETQAAGAGDGTSGSGESEQTPDLRQKHSALARVTERFERRVVIANREWLATLEDDPGRFLAARLLSEQARRRRLGVLLPPAEDPM